MNTSSPFKEGLIDGIPIGLGYLFVSFGFGISVVNAGLSTLIAVIMSATNVTSAGQMAGLIVLVEHGTLLEMILTQFIINLRYSLMGITLSQRIDQSFTTPKRLLLSFFITDEIFAVSSTKNRKVGAVYFSGLSVFPYIGWTLGTLLGAVAGQILPSLLTNCMNILIYGMFIAIIIPPAKKEKGVLFGLLLAISLSCLFYFLPLFHFISSGFSVIISAVISSAVVALFFPVVPDPKTSQREEGET